MTLVQTCAVKSETKSTLRPFVRFRKDIQGLRALAVVLVVIYHLWPTYLTGGYVGVDVFFVISGFLITDHLVEQPPRTPRDVASFWGRRVRRLLPASLLVVATTAVAGVFVLPVTQLHKLAQEITSSALYFQNWVLAGDSVDYLASQDSPSPLQHYWSLSVEEQFYLVWPLVIAVIYLVSHERFRRTGLLVGLGAITVGSFLTSIAWTSISPASAYFVTPTRLWELGLGGLAAITAPVLPRLGNSTRSLIAWAGLGLICLSAIWFTALTPFPGYWAAIPVVGTAMIILANAPASMLSPTRLLQLRPAQVVGDASYSIYLWHWSLIVLVTGALGGVISWEPKLIILIASLGLAAVTKRFVEDPVRRSSWLSSSSRKTFIVAAVVTASVATMSLIPTSEVSQAIAASARASKIAVARNGNCYGAGSLVTVGCTPHGFGVVPTPAAAIYDKPDAYNDGCLEGEPFSKVVTCTYGAKSHPKYRIALVGNSHAAQWLPALQAIAATRDIQITTYIASGCMPTAAFVVFDTAANENGCHAWGANVIKETISKQFDLIVYTAASNSDIVNVPAAKKLPIQVMGYQTILNEWSAAHIPVLVIRDTPLPFFNVPQCVATHRNKLNQCDGLRTKWEFPDPIGQAAALLNSTKISVIDLNNHFCDSKSCYGVLGGVLVYFDYMHADSTFIRSLAPYLAPAIDNALKG